MKKSRFTDRWLLAQNIVLKWDWLVLPRWLVLPHITLTTILSSNFSDLILTFSDWVGFGLKRSEKVGKCQISVGKGRKRSDSGRKRSENVEFWSEKVGFQVGKSLKRSEKSSGGDLIFNDLIEIFIKFMYQNSRNDYKRVLIKRLLTVIKGN